MSVWDVSQVTSLEEAFRSYDGPYYDLHVWNVNKVTSMDNAFSNTQHNWNASTWNVASVTTLNQFMYNAGAFNRVRHWQSWCFWQLCFPSDSDFLFNGPQDVSTWDVGNVNDFFEV